MTEQPTTAEAVESAKQRGLTPCQCRTHIAYRVTASDIPEDDASTFEEYDVYETCGTVTHRTYAPGHDAKLKSLLINLNREGKSYHYLSGGSIFTVEPSTLAAELNWSHFLTPAKPKAVRKARKSNLDGQAGQVKVGRWSYPATVLADHGATLDVVYTNKRNEEIVLSGIETSKFIR